MIYDDGCHLDQSSDKPGECVFGDPEASATVVLMGDSHAAQWFPAMDEGAREKGYRKWRKAVQRTFDWVDDDDE